MLSFIGTTSGTGQIGVELTSSGARLVQVRRHRNDIRVQAAAEFAEGAGDPEAFQRALRAGGFRGRRCVVTLPWSDYHVQSIRMPSLPDAELAQAVRWEAAERFNLNREGIETSFVRLGEVSRGNETRDEVLLLAVERDRVGDRLEPLFQAGLKPSALDAPMSALVRCYSTRCRREADMSHVRMIVDVGREGTTILVARGSDVALCKRIEIGGDQFDQLVADYLDIDLAMARDLRNKRIERRLLEGASEGEDDSRDRAVFEAVRGALDQICKEIGLCLRYYGVTFRGHPPLGLILTGRDGLEPHLDEMIGRSCNINAMLDDPASPVEGILREISDAIDSAGPPHAFAIAAGLSLRGLLKRSREHEGPGTVRREAA